MNERLTAEEQLELENEFEDEVVVSAIFEDAEELGNYYMDNVVKTTVFLADMAMFAEMNEVYAKYFKFDFPARSAVAVKTLPKGGLVEIEVIASK